jgi:hypothetical protein
MNYLLFPMLFIAGVLYSAGVISSHRLNRAPFITFCIFGCVIALPEIFFAVYYLKFLGTPLWLCEFRSTPGSELSAAGAGLLAGLLHGNFSGGARFRRIAGRWFFPAVLVLGLFVPYLKPIVRPPDWKLFQDRWSDDVCLQTSESSCGPACAATLLRRLGKIATEKEMARASFTSRNGTENWFLARALRKRGCAVQFVYEPDAGKPWPFPSIAGVRLPGSGNTGHFIAILDRIGDQYIIGDPLEGKVVQSQAALQNDYEFTGFFMTVK